MRPNTAEAPSGASPTGGPVVNTAIRERATTSRATRSGGASPRNSGASRAAGSTVRRAAIHAEKDRHPIDRRAISPNLARTVRPDVRRGGTVHRGGSAHRDDRNGGPAAIVAINESRGRPDPSRIADPGRPARTGKPATVHGGRNPGGSRSLPEVAGRDSAIGHRRAIVRAAGSGHTVTGHAVAATGHTVATDHVVATDHA